MLFSASRKLLFIHVYKTGGTSIIDTLQTELRRTQTLQEKLVERLSNRGLMGSWTARVGQLPQHASARQVRDVVPSRFFQKCFKFAFVRNPWSLQLSLYRYVLSSPTHPQHDVFKRLKSFEAYIEWLATRPSGAHRTQRDFLTGENGQLLVDFVGRFEHLTQDFSLVADRLGLGNTLSHLNPSGPKVNYRNYYSERTRRIVEELHQEDILTFGFDFESCASVGRNNSFIENAFFVCCRPPARLRKTLPA